MLDTTKKRLSKRKSRKYITAIRLFMGAFMCLATILFLIVYLWYYNTSVQEMEEKSRLMVRVAQQEIDSQLNEIHEISMNLKNDFDVLSAFTTKAPYEEYRLTKKLRGLTGIHTQIDDIAIIGYDNQVCSTKGMTDWSQYCSSAISTRQDAPPLFPDTGPPQSSSFYSLYPSAKEDTRIPEQVLLYVQPQDARKMLYLVQSAVFTEPLEKLFPEYNGTLSILDSAGTTLISIPFGGTDFDDAKAAACPPEKPDDPYTYLQISSQAGAFQYGILTEKAAFGNNLHKLEKTFAIVFLTSLLIEAAASLLFRRFSGRPILQLQNTVLQNNYTQTGWQDLDDIGNEFRKVKEDLQQTDQRLQVDRAFLRGSLVCGLVNSSYSYAFNKEAYLREGMDFSQGWFQAALLLLKTEFNAGCVEIVRKTPEKFGVSCYFSDRNEYGQVILVLHGNAGDDLFQAMVATGKALETAGCSFCIHAGQVVARPHLIQLSFFQAISADGGQNQSIVFYREKPPAAGQPSPYDIVEELKQLLTGTDPQNASAYIHALLKKAGDLSNQFLLYSNIVEYLLSTTEEMVAEEETGGSGLLTSALYSAFRDTDAMAETILSLVRQQITGTADHPFLQQLNTFIEKNYQDSMLTVQQIADHFQISPSHLNNLAKKENGKTAFSLLDQKRMEHAKELLASDADCPIRNIVENSGYGDLNYFSKKFKRQTGMTPGEYRLLMHGGTR